MRGLARCLAGDAVAVFGHPAGEGAWALHRTSRLACRSERREGSERGGGGCAARGEMQVKRELTRGFKHAERWPKGDSGAWCPRLSSGRAWTWLQRVRFEVKLWKISGAAEAKGVDWTRCSD